MSMSSMMHSRPSGPSLAAVSFWASCGLPVSELSLGLVLISIHNDSLESELWEEGRECTRLC